MNSKEFTITRVKGDLHKLAPVLIKSTAVRSRQ
ncbi:hypothetical protein [Shewanella benthica]